MAPHFLADPRLRKALTAVLRRRVPQSEVDDIVQATLTEALAATHAPTDPDELQRWMWGIAHNKVVDYFRRARRERFELPEVPAEDAPHEQLSLLRWAKEELPPGAEETFDWLLREGEGEKLEAIAASAEQPAPRIRKRVSLLRKHLRSRWAKEVAALAAIGILAVVLLFGLRKERAPGPITRDIPRAPDHRPLPEVEAERERARAFELCDAREWQPCIDSLERAKAIDPPGDASERVQDARHRATRALAPLPTPVEPSPLLTPVPTAVPSAGPVPTSSLPFRSLDSSSVPTRAKPKKPSGGKTGASK